MKKLLPATIMLFCLASAPVLTAQENAEKATEEKTGEEGSPRDAILKWVDLLILIGGVGYLLKKPASAFFLNRTNEITAGLERAKTAQEESGRRMKEIEQRLSRMSAEIASLQVQADAESAQERENIIGDTKREMERLVDQSRQEIDRIARGVERDIKEKIADAVIDRAGRTLETQMTENDQKRIVVRFLNKV